MKYLLLLLLAGCGMMSNSSDRDYSCSVSCANCIDVKLECDASANKDTEITQQEEGILK